MHSIPHKKKNHRQYPALRNSLLHPIHGRYASVNMAQRRGDARHPRPYHSGATMNPSARAGVEHALPMARSSTPSKPCT